MHLHRLQNTVQWERCHIWFLEISMKSPKFGLNVFIVVTLMWPYAPHASFYCIMYCWVYVLISFWFLHEGVQMILDQWYECMKTAGPSFFMFLPILVIILVYLTQLWKMEFRLDLNWGSLICYISEILIYMNSNFSIWKPILINLTDLFSAKQVPGGYKLPKGSPLV